MQGGISKIVNASHLQIVPGQLDNANHSHVSYSDNHSHLPWEKPPLVRGLGSAMAVSGAPRTTQVTTVLAGLVLGPAALAQQAPRPTPTPQERRTVKAERLQAGETITLDGRLDEPVWSRATKLQDFVQVDPANGQAPTELTDVKVVFSADALYLGVFAHDSEGTAHLQARLVTLSPAASELPAWSQRSLATRYIASSGIRWVIGGSAGMMSAWIAGSHLIWGREKTFTNLVFVVLSIALAMALLAYVGVPGIAIFTFPGIVNGRLAALGYPTPTAMGLAISLPFALAAAWQIQQTYAITGVVVPFLGPFEIPAWAYIAFAAFAIVATSNGVNITDGLDGLAGGTLIFAFGGYMVIATVAAPLAQPNLAALCALIIGGLLGFLWFNAPPAQIFMGDTGSLALGGLLGTVAVATKHEIVLAIVGGLFVLEAVSVIIQVASFKLTGKRIFLMAPIHHHFEKLGWKEPQIVIRFWIISVILALIGLSTLKLR